MAERDTGSTPSRELGFWDKAFMAAITTRTSGEFLVVGFVDSKLLDRQRIDQVYRQLEEVVPQTVHKKLMLDFSGVSFISSAMITKLVMLNKACKAQGVTLKCSEVSPNIMEVFKIARLTTLFEITASAGGQRSKGADVPKPIDDPADEA